jgi:hypothetical protein
MPWLMLTPVAYMTAAAIRRNEPISTTLRLIANALCTVLMIGAASAVLMHGGAWLMPIAQTFAVATLAYILATIAAPKSIYAYIATLCASLATVLLLVDQNASNLLVVSLLSVLALAQVIAGRAFSGVVGQRTADSLKQAGFVLVSLLSFGQVLFSLSLMVQDMIQIETALSLGAVAIAAALAATMANNGWKRWLLTLSVGQGIVAMGMMAHLSQLSANRKFEIFSVAIGTLLLAVGHIAWQREQNTSSKSDTASFGLTLGSLLAAVPLLIAVIATRCTTGLSLPDELAMLTAGAILFVAGLVLQIRSTTLVGGIALGIHLVILMISAGMRAQLAVGVYLAIGGGLLFATGILLSIYRERLLEIPNDVKQRKGVFRVLSWR